MNTRNYLAPLAFGLFLCSCPGGEFNSSMEDDSAEAEEAARDFDATLEEVAGDIDAAAKTASDKITDENAEASLDELSKSIEGGN